MTSERNNSRIHNKLPVAKEGFPFIAAGMILSFVLFLATLEAWAVFAALLTGFVIYFFRDPKRAVAACQEGTLLASADGKILGIEQVEGVDNPLEAQAIKVSIFMSPFNVHVNRVPAGGTIERIAYRPGKFFRANLDKSSEENEKNVLVMKTSGSHRIAFTQIAGFIARRIVCWVAEKDRVSAGQRFGLIRFGSRMDMFVPAHSKIIAHVDQRVKAGTTIIGYLP